MKINFLYVILLTFIGFIAIASSSHSYRQEGHLGRTKIRNRVYAKNSETLPNNFERRLCLHELGYPKEKKVSISPQLNHRIRSRAISEAATMQNVESQKIIPNASTTEPSKRNSKSETDGRFLNTEAIVSVINLLENEYKPFSESTQTDSNNDEAKVQFVESFCQQLKIHRNKINSEQTKTLSNDKLHQQDIVAPEVSDNSNMELKAEELHYLNFFIEACNLNGKPENSKKKIRKFISGLHLYRKYFMTNLNNPLVIENAKNEKEQNKRESEEVEKDG